MPAKHRIPCEYCLAVNPGNRRTCLACGAPLPKLAPVKKTTPKSDLPVPVQTLESARKGGEEVDKLFTNAVYAYSLLWRTVAEALAITVVTLAIGVTAGVTGVPFLGAAGGLLVGLAVGWPIKIAYLTMLMAPAGMVIGAVLGLVLWAVGLSQAVAVPMILLAVLGGAVGGRRVAYARRNLWEKLRPFLGALGGLGFGILGTLIGWGLQSVVSAWLG
jgi:hypothetical protein